MGKRHFLLNTIKVLGVNRHEENGYISVPCKWPICLCSFSLLVNGFTLHQTGCLGLGLNGRGPAHCHHASSVTRTLLNLMVVASSVVKQLMCHIHTHPFLPSPMNVIQTHRDGNVLGHNTSTFWLFVLVSDLHCKTYRATAAVENHSSPASLPAKKEIHCKPIHCSAVSQKWCLVHVCCGGKQCVSLSRRQRKIESESPEKRSQWEKVIIADVCNGRWARVDVAAVKISAWYIFCESSATSLSHYQSLR